MGTRTRVATLGACAVGLSTLLEDRGVGLESVYVGHPAVDTHGTHLILGGAVCEVETHDVTQALIPVLYARRRCLYDHLQRLHEFVAELGIGRLQADVLDETLLTVES